MNERKRTENKRRILLQIAYIEGVPNVKMNMSRKNEIERLKWKEEQIVALQSAYVWVGNHQKLVVYLRASLLHTLHTLTHTMPMMLILERKWQPCIHILHNIHLFFTQFPCHSLSFTLSRCLFLHFFLHSPPVPFSSVQQFSSFVSNELFTWGKTHQILHFTILLHQFQIPKASLQTSPFYGWYLIYSFIFKYHWIHSMWINFGAVDLQETERHK